MGAGREDATASSGGTPRRDSTGVAKEEPPTPKRPKRIPTATPPPTTASSDVKVPTTSLGAPQGHTYRGWRPPATYPVSRARWAPPGWGSEGDQWVTKA